MQEKYWNTFQNSGKITDYLYYKGMDICESVMSKYSEEVHDKAKIGEETIESNNSNGNCDRDHSNWRI